jgi:hypothetical protein
MTPDPEIASKHAAREDDFSELMEDFESCLAAALT